MTQASPLHWPDGWKRTKPVYREDGSSRFSYAAAGSRKKTPITLARARDSLIHELKLMGASNIVISTDLKLRLDGLPYSNQRQPEDPGVAVYFVRKGEAMVMARDAFLRIEDNMRSLALAVEGLRQMQRHGGATMMDRAFSGFTALPPPDQLTPIVTPQPQRAWCEVLGVAQDAPLAVIKGAYRALAMEAGGATAELNAAYEAAKTARKCGNEKSS